MIDLKDTIYMRCDDRAMQKELMLCSLFLTKRNFISDIAKKEEQQLKESTLSQQRKV